MSFDFTTLITDRAQADVNRVKQIAEKIKNGTASESELAEFNSAAMKGSYNYTDLNRVTAAMEYLKSQLEGYGYAVPGYQRIEVPHPEEVRLPEGYTELAWIESTGTQYIDTLFKSNYNSRIVAEVQFKEEPQIVAIFGTRNATTDDYFCFYAPEQQGYCLRIDGAYNYVTASAVEKNVVDANKNVLTIGNQSVTGAITDFSANYPLYLFAANNAGTAQYIASAKLFSCKIYDDDTLVRNYIPCITPNGEVGLYDRVTKSFFGNSGTGAFVAGDLVEVTQESESNYDPYLWYEVDYPTESTMVTYLGNVTAIRSVLAVMETTPDTPSDMVDLTVAEANNIEKILEDVDLLLTRAAQAWFYAGDVFSGEV